MKLLLSLAVVAVGAYFSVAGKFYVCRNFGQAFRVFLRGNQKESKGIDTFASLCTHLGATIGTGNILGVALALMSGGPGALFWMVVGSVFGMSTKFYENCLAVRYRTTDSRGEPLGGPFCYMEANFGQFGQVLAWLFAVSCLTVGLLGMGTVIQSNSIALAVGDIIPAKLHVRENDMRILIALGITVPAAMVILGGGKRIVQVSTRLVPIMAVGYLLICGRILWCCRSEIPNAAQMVIQGAFGWKAIGGGFSGALVAKAATRGVQMGIFSNEAGLGSGPISAGSCQDADPLEQGFAGAMAVFVDTVVLCTLTGLTLLVTGAWQHGTNAVAVTTEAWSAGLSMKPMTARIMLALFLCVFSFTSILGWNFFAERSAEFLFANAKATQVYQILYLMAVFVGPFLTAEFVWKMGETTTWFMLIPNLLMLFMLRKKALKITNGHKSSPR